MVNGKKTVWCAQHDEKRLWPPAPARAYEPGIVFRPGKRRCRATILMAIPDIPVAGNVVAARFAEPSKWFKAAQVEWHSRVKRIAGNRVVVADPNAPPLWARFYDLDTGKPFFCGRDGIKHDNMADIEAERRNGLLLGTAPARATLLSRDYPSVGTTPGANRQP